MSEESSLYSAVEPGGGSADVQFSTDVRRATRKIHNVSDALVNSKLVLASSDENVWADALLIFFDVFSRLEEIKEELNMPEINSLFVDDIMYRTKAFKTDLNFYLGNNWENTYVRRKEVSEYLDHLDELRDERPLLLCAYIYHLYMGLLSGGQIIKTKKVITKRFSISNLFPWNFTETEVNPHVGILEFGDTNISELKKKLRSALNDLASDWTAEQKCAFINESQMVFFYNNQIIRTVRGTFKAIIWIMLYSGAVAVVLFYVLSYIY